MAKKKERTTVQIQNLNLEIDYDKLADAIVKAQRKSEEHIEPISKKKGHFFKRLWHFISNKSNTGDTYTFGFFQGFCEMFFRFLSVVEFMLFLLSIGAFFYLPKVSMNIDLRIMIITLLIVGVFLFFVLAVMSWGMANEVTRENNLSRIMSLLSNLVGILALIVALIALFKGWIPSPNTL